MVHVGADHQIHEGDSSSHFLTFLLSYAADYADEEVWILFLAVFKFTQPTKDFLGSLFSDATRIKDKKISLLRDSGGNHSSMRQQS